jgi:hypothetical protein
MGGFAPAAIKIAANTFKTQPRDEANFTKAQGELKMQFMMIVKVNGETKAGVIPSEELLAAMTKDNEALMKAGVLVDLTGLQPTSKGACSKFSGDKVTVVDGPFAETKEWIG